MPSEENPLVRLVTTEGGIAEVTIARPAVRNALNEPTALALNDALATVAADPQVRCVILRGEGSAFCAGADLAEFEKASTQPASQRLATLFLPALRSMMTMEKPVIAAVSGADTSAMVMVVQKELQAAPFQWMPNSVQPMAKDFT